MTNRTNARLAGYTFLRDIAASITSVVFTGRPTSGEVIAAKLADIAARNGEAHCRMACAVHLFRGIRVGSDALS